MEARDRERILQALENNAELRRLYDEHEILQDELARFENRTFLTVNEEMELKRLKKKKLMGCDRMMQILSEQDIVGEQASAN